MTTYVSLRIKIIVLLFVMLGGLTYYTNKASINLISKQMHDSFARRVLNSRKAAQKYWDVEKNNLLNLAMLYAENQRIIALCAENLEKELQEELTHLTARTAFYDMSVKLCRDPLVESRKTENYLSKIIVINDNNELFLKAEVPVIKQGALIGRLALKQQLNQSYVKNMANYLQTGISLALQHEVVASSLESNLASDLSAFHFQGPKDSLSMTVAQLGEASYSVSCTLLENAHDGTPIYLYTAISLERLLSIISDYDYSHRKIALWTFVIALIISIAFTEIVLISRIKNIQNSAGIIADGNLEHRINSKHSDELGSLAGSFDKMADALKANRQKVKEYIKSIEEMANQRKLIEMQLYHADKLSSIGKLSASIAHEIKNPLASIKALAQLISEDMADESERKEYAQVIVSEVGRLNEVVAQLLQYARPEEGKFNKIGVREIIQPVISLLNHEAERYRTSLSMEIEDGLELFADGEKMKQAILNLVINAIQAMPKSGGEIKIKALSKPEEESILISIEDNGEGMPHEILEQLFDPFFTTKQRGTGLGLAIVKKIIDLHSGTIGIESSEGAGTIVNIFLKKMIE